jgi:amidohydrolase
MRRALLALLLMLFALPAAGSLPDFADLAARVEEQVRADRRWLHEHAELSLREHETRDYLLEALAGIKGVELVDGDWGTGLIAMIKGGKPGPIVAWRADMDGLPITEATGLPFACQRSDTLRSGRVTGVMHACGHDMHMAIGLGVARVFSKLRKDLPGSLLLIFEPGEEIGAGALQLLEAGVFEEGRKPAVALALHVHPTLTLGTVGACPGPATANVDGFVLTVKGEGGHGAYPHRGTDPVTLSARIILALQSLVSREIDVNHNAVISIGHIEGGAKSNVIPDEVLLEATVRSHDDETREALKEKIERTVMGLAAAAGAPEPDLQYYYGTAAGTNDPELVAQVRGVVREQLGDAADVQYLPGMGGEDFAYFGREVPGFQFRLGVVPEGAEPMSLHRSSFDPEEAALTLGVQVATAALWDQLLIRR